MINIIVGVETPPTSYSDIKLFLQNDLTFTKDPRPQVVADWFEFYRNQLVGRVGHFSSNTTNLFCNFIVVFNGNC